MQWSWPPPEMAVEVTIRLSALPKDRGVEYPTSKRFRNLLYLSPELLPVGRKEEMTYYRYNETSDHQAFTDSQWFASTLHLQPKTSFIKKCSSTIYLYPWDNGRSKVSVSTHTVQKPTVIDQSGDELEDNGDEIVEKRSENGSDSEALWETSLEAILENIGNIVTDEATAFQTLDRRSRKKADQEKVFVGHAGTKHVHNGDNIKLDVNGYHSGDHAEDFDSLERKLACVSPVPPEFATMNGNHKSQNGH